VKITRLMPAPPTILGYRSDGHPIHQIAGGSGDIEIEPSDEGEGGTEGEGTGDAWQAPSKTEWLKVQAALSKSNGSAKQRREALAAKDKETADLQARLAEYEAAEERRELLEKQGGGTATTVVEEIGKKRKGTPAGVRTTTTAVPPDAPKIPEGLLTKAQVKQLTETAKRDGEQAASARFRSMAVNQAARAALSGSGVQATNMGRLVRLLDLDEIEIDEEGEITAGLDEQIETLKAELPQLFKAPEPEKSKKRTPPPRVNGSARAEAEERPRSSAEQIAAQVLSGR
jgi:hypothetical protein